MSNTMDDAPDLTQPLSVAAEALGEPAVATESLDGKKKSRRSRGPAICPGCQEEFSSRTGLANHKRSCPKIKPDERPTPRKNAGAAGSASRVSKPTLQSKLAGLITTASLAVSFVDAYDGQVIAANADALAEALTDLAARNPAIKARLESLVTGSDYTALGIVLVSIILPIALHHSPALRETMGGRADQLAANLSGVANSQPSAAGAPTSPPSAAAPA